MADVSIQGIFGNRFLKESFTLNLKEGVSIKEFFFKDRQSFKDQILQEEP